VDRNWRDHVIAGPRFVRISETGPTVTNANKARERLQWRLESKFDDMVAEMVDAHVVALVMRIELKTSRMIP